MRAAIETGVGLTAAKLMVGKSVAKSDETYIAKAKLDEVFKKLSKYLSVTGAEEDKKPLQEIVVQQESVRAQEDLDQQARQKKLWKLAMLPRRS